MFTMKPNIGINMRVTGHCNQGGRKYMEDAFAVGYQQSENLKDLIYAYFGIFDGHGGKEAALYAKEKLMNNIVCQKGFWSEDDSRVLKAIREGFLVTHEGMWKEVGNWPRTVNGFPSTSGTTSSVAFIRKQKLYIGHVGDSKIVLGCQFPESKEWIAQSVTRDHKPECPEEKKRIESVGGLVMKKSGVQRVVWNRPSPTHKGPIRRSTPVEQIPFLAVSRSLGDLWSYNLSTNEFVVSPEPDVEVIQLNPRVHRCIIFGSDGLWNMITPQAAIKIVQKTDEENEKIILEGGKEKLMNNPSRLLVDTALKYWFDLGMRADNISVVNVMLDPPGPCKREVLLRQRVLKRLRPRDEQIIEDETTSKPNKVSTVKDTSMSSNMKDRKRPFDCVDSSKEQKLNEPHCKERKLSRDSFESVPRNLPHPVILSPIKVIKSNPSASSSTPTSNSPDAKSEDTGKDKSAVAEPENCDSSSVIEKPSDANPSIAMSDDKVIKKGHDPPNDEVSTSNLKETENKFTSAPSSTQFQSDSCEKVGESSKNDHCTNSKEKTNLPLSGKNDLISKTEKNDSSYQTNSSSKENGRVHLCEVDNFLKLDRTSDCNDSRNGKSKDLQKPDSILSPKVKNFRKSTLPFRNNALRRKCLITLRKPRLQKNQSACRTRAQSNIQKLKV